MDKNAPRTAAATGAGDLSLPDAVVDHFLSPLPVEGVAGAHDVGRGIAVTPSQNTDDCIHAAGLRTMAGAGPVRLVATS